MAKQYFWDYKHENHILNKSLVPQKFQATYMWLQW